MVGCYQNPVASSTGTGGSNPVCSANGSCRRALPRARLLAPARYASPTRTPDERIVVFQDEAARRPSDVRGPPPTMMRCFVSWTPPAAIGLPSAYPARYSIRDGSSAVRRVISAASAAAAYTTVWPSRVAILSGLPKTFSGDHHVDKGGDVRGGPAGMGAPTTLSTSTLEVVRCLSTFRTYSSPSNS